MSRAPMKYQFFNQWEQGIGAGGTVQGEVAQFEAPEDGTVVSCLVDWAGALESGSATQNVHGYVRLVVNRAGNTVGTMVRSTVIAGDTVDWDAVGGADTIADADQGDTWAIAPISMGPGTNQRVTLNPKTARRLRRQDRLSVEVWLSNSGAESAPVGMAATGTLFYLT